MSDLFFVDDILFLYIYVVLRIFIDYVIFLHIYLLDLLLMGFDFFFNDRGPFYSVGHAIFFRLSIFALFSFLAFLFISLLDDIYISKKDYY